jgi:hypothetical protein
VTQDDPFHRFTGFTTQLDPFHTFTGFGTQDEPFQTLMPPVPPAPDGRSAIVTEAQE